MGTRLRALPFWRSFTDGNFSAKKKYTSHITILKIIANRAFKLGFSHLFDEYNLKVRLYNKNYCKIIVLTMKLGKEISLPPYAGSSTILKIIVLCFPIDIIMI